jgi:hypothetical protein
MISAPQHVEKRQPVALAAARAIDPRFRKHRFAVIHQ